MALLSVSNLKKMFADRLLFDNVSFQVDESDKIGFIGENGVGKSTLFKILLGIEEYESGDIFKNKSMCAGYLEQYSCYDSDKTIMEEFLEVFHDIIEIEDELNELQYDIDNKNGNLDELVSRQNRLHEQYIAFEGAFFRSKIKSTLIGLGFSEDEFDKKVSTLSGGQKTRVALGKILLSDVNILFLDEPTNHLDIESVSWLENFLRSYKGAFIVISHDRYFLDRVCNRIISLESQRFFSFRGNYSQYTAWRELERKTSEREYENTKKEIDRLEGIVEQQRRWNREKNIKTAESKLKVIKKLEESLESPLEDTESIAFKFVSGKRGANDVLIARGLSKSFDRQIFRNVDIDIKRGERVFLLGPNGCGKTTLLKMIIGEEDGVKIGSNIEIGYYDQIQENLSDDKTVMDELWDEYPQLNQTEVRNALAVFLFRGEDVFKKVDSLSGGERARVLLAKLMLKKANFLIMDEPTNHLDIESREALENALADYDGTIFCVSHDRYFINKLSTRILELNPGGLKSYAGNYDYYSERVSEAEKEKTQDSISKGTDYQEQKRIAAQRRKLVNDIAKAEKRIAELEDDIKRFGAELEKPEIAADYVKALEITEKINNSEKRLDGILSVWSELQEKAESEGI